MTDDACKLVPVNERANAYRVVRTALERKDIIRPANCSRCLAADTIGTSGRHTIQAHHYMGYNHPLAIEWLCPKCHRANTPLPAVMGAPTRGEANGASKLTEEEIRAIRGASDGCRRIAARYGLAKSTVQRIRTRKMWSHVA